MEIRDNQQPHRYFKSMEKVISRATYHEPRLNMIHRTLQNTRIQLFLFLLALYISASFLQPLLVMVKYFSYWSLHFATISLVTSYLSG
jgi:hypothetical protein